MRRRRGKPPRARQQALVEDFLPRIAPGGVTREENPNRAPLDLASLFGRAAPVWLEIGFGAGEHLVWQAERNSDVGLIGAEPFMSGVGACLAAERHHFLFVLRTENNQRLLLASAAVAAAVWGMLSRAPASSASSASATSAGV